MKKVFISILFVFLALTAKSAFSQTISNCDVSKYCGPWTPASMYVTMPESPNCPILIDFRYRDCTINGVTFRELDIIRANEPNLSDPECQGVKNQYFGGTFLNADYFWFTVFEQISLSFFEEIKTTDPQRVDCSNPNGGFTVTLNSASCHRYAYFQGTSENYGRLERYNCNDLICCTQSIRYCWNHETNEMEEWDYQDNYLSGNCEANPAPIPGALSVSECKSPCQ